MSYIYALKMNLMLLCIHCFVQFRFMPFKIAVKLQFVLVFYQKQVETCENRNSELEAQMESLLQQNKKMSLEVSRLMDVDKKYMAANKNVEHYMQLLQKAEETIEKQKEDLATQEILVNSFFKYSRTSPEPICIPKNAEEFNISDSHKTLQKHLGDAMRNVL